MYSYIVFHLRFLSFTFLVSRFNGLAKMLEEKPLQSFRGHDFIKIQNGEEH